MYLWNVRPCSSTKSNTLEVAETLDDLHYCINTCLAVVLKRVNIRPINVTNR